MPTIEITQQFGFDAAHYLEQAPSSTNRRMHGHSFYAEVTLRGERDPVKGWVRDFGEVNVALSSIRTELDHQLLNEIAGLGAPTLENLACYIFREAKTRLPEVCRVKLSRPSSGQSCVYEETGSGAQ
ncbi:MAG TPA: 6-carboxytetrahydropterin synthase [Micropepsaceae bacterium]|nr:6-carboxytetrahydropterin synthase [Micropepsaceae bacterium]